MVELVQDGRSPEELEREFEPTAQSIRNWHSQSKRDAGRIAMRVGTEEWLRRWTNQRMARYRRTTSRHIKPA
jgi:hypothetical protein